MPTNHDRFCRCHRCKPGTIHAARDAETLHRLRVCLIIASLLVAAMIVWPAL